MDAVPAPTSLTDVPEPTFVMSEDGFRLATYSWGEEAQPTVLLVHGFASSTRDNWVGTGWVRDLTRAGYRVLALDQRGHGASDKPHDAREYALSALARDVETVLETYLVDTASYVGYSLGARVGWEVARHLGARIERVVLGGVPDGVPLSKLDLAQARAYVREGAAVTDAQTQQYIRLIERVGGNDLEALLAIAAGLRASGAADPDPATAPTQPVLIATGSRDAILEGSKALADACPAGRFVEIPDRHHFNAPGSRDFRGAARAFLAG
ncbi:alpha/beta fold hydrolase [Microbacterium xanthum]|uniref:alpha/beta fold hydrolase n=1 Tax=Microbacterium xanthum TaxID=3079794 RepID=UPI002AD48AFE|nr:alpha/beta hydrolase [Microbacterium sp. KSW-48]MDZ8170671.1 alpha/beta hydrolase [Microbacterium sp. KSW-48]